MASGTYFLLQILGSAALLLWGIRMARTGVMRAYGPVIRRILPRALASRPVAIAAGAAAAAVLQSSTAVAVFIASMATLGVVPLVGGLALMLGADVGGALVAALLTLNVKGAWPALILLGYILHTAFDDGNSIGKQAGRFLLGLGLVLVALTAMSAASGNLASSETIRMVLRSLSDEPLLATLIMAVLTWVAHSSMSMLLFIASLAADGVVDSSCLVAATVLGINLGSGVSAVFLTWGQAPSARRIIVGNGLFRLAGVTAGFLLLEWPAALYDRLPWSAGPRVIALHVGFNVTLALVFSGLLPQVAGLLERLLPNPPARPEDNYGPRYIPPIPGAFQAALPLSALTRETLRLSDVVHVMLTETKAFLESAGREQNRLAEVRRLDDRADTLYAAIRGYAVDLSKTDLPKDELRKVTWLLRHSLSLENVGDIIDKSLLDIMSQKVRGGHSFSLDGHAELSGMFDYVVESLELSTDLLMGWRSEAARELARRKDAFKRKVRDSSERHLNRLRLGVSQSLETSSFHLDILNDLQRVNSLIAGVAEDMTAEDDDSSGTGD